MTNPPVLHISNTEYNLYVKVDTETLTVSLRDYKTDDLIYDVSFNEINAVQLQSDVKQSKKPFIDSVAIAYQILKYIPYVTPAYNNGKDKIFNTAKELKAHVAECINRTILHFNNREQEIILSTEKDMQEITGVIDYLNNLSTQSVKETNSLELQVKATVNDTTYIININDKLSIDIIDKEDANITYKLQYDPDNSSVLQVINKNFNNTIHTIPTFILQNNKMDEEEIKALRSTYKLFDATCQGYRILQHFHNSGTFSITDKAYDIKQQVYSALGYTPFILK